MLKFLESIGIQVSDRSGHSISTSTVILQTLLRDNCLDNSKDV